MNNYHVSKEKVDLITDILVNQSNLDLNDKLVDFYINILKGMCAAGICFRDTTKFDYRFRGLYNRFVVA